MSRVIAVVEGQTERDFVIRVLAPYLINRGVYLSARLIGKPGHKGGVGDYQRAKVDLMVVLKTDSSAFVTTMFDLYGMPLSWPKRQRESSLSGVDQAKAIEQAMAVDICQALGRSFVSTRFLPYVQVHEFEALMFSEPVKLCDVMRAADKLKQLAQIRNQFATPEDINDGPATAPSKRLQSIFFDYRKRLHGMITAQHIGIEPMRLHCPHFNEWVSRLETVAPPTSGSENP